MPNNRHQNLFKDYQSLDQRQFPDEMGQSLITMPKHQFQKNVNQENIYRIANIINQIINKEESKSKAIKAFYKDKVKREDIPDEIKGLSFKGINKEEKIRKFNVLYRFLALNFSDESLLFYVRFLYNHTSEQLKSFIDEQLEDLYLVDLKLFESWTEHNSLLDRLM